MDALNINDISVFFGRLAALENVSLSIRSGERRGLIGPNGSGKTTLFNVISGFIAPTAGDVYLFGNKTTAKSPHKNVMMGVARTFQITNIFHNLSVVDNLLLALDQKIFNLQSFKFRSQSTLEKAEKLLQELDLQEKKHSMASTLSHGEQRVLEIALTLAINPKILLLDEPMAGLSVGEVSIMKNIIQNIPSDITLFIIEHDMDVIFDIAEKITVLNHGEVIVEASGDEIKSNSLVHDIYLGKT